MHILRSNCLSLDLVLLHLYNANINGKAFYFVSFTCSDIAVRKSAVSRNTGNKEKAAKPSGENKSFELAEESRRAV